MSEHERRHQPIHGNGSQQVDRREREDRGGRTGHNQEQDETTCKVPEGSAPVSATPWTGTSVVGRCGHELWFGLRPVLIYVGGYHRSTFSTAILLAIHADGLEALLKGDSPTETD